MFTYWDGVLDGEYGCNAEKRHAPQVRVSVAHDGERVFHIEAWAGTQRGIAVLKALKERLEPYL